MKGLFSSHPYSFASPLRVVGEKKKGIKDACDVPFEMEGDFAHPEGYELNPLSLDQGS